jgi:transposase
MLPDWTLAPVVAALQTMRGMALVNAATLIAELGDLSRFANPRQLMAYLGRAVRAFERCKRQTRRPHQSRQQRGPPAADRGVLDLPLTSPGQPRAAAPAGGAAQADPREPGKRSCGGARAIASSPAAASRPNVVTAAITRELAGFIWAIARRVPPAAG